MSSTKTKNSKRFTIVLLIVLLLALAVGYAAFSDTLTISGTANAKGNFDLQFVKDTTTPENGCYVKNAVGCTATVDVVADGDSQANDQLTVTVTDLAYPGAGADIQAVIKNVGTVPAKVKAVTLTPASGNNGNAIVVTGLEQVTASHPRIEPNGTCTFDFTVMWKDDVFTLDPTKDGENVNNTNEKFSFTLEIQYEQDTSTNLNVTPAHSDANAPVNSGT